MISKERRKAGEDIEFSPMCSAQGSAKIIPPLMLRPLPPGFTAYLAFRLDSCFPQRCLVHLG